MPETTPLIKAALNLRGGAGFEVYGFSPHLHCRTQKRPCQSGRNSEPTKSFSYTYLLRVLPQISFSSQAKGFAKNEDKSFALGISAIQTRQVVALT